MSAAGKASGSPRARIAMVLRGPLADARQRPQSGHERLQILPAAQQRRIPGRRSRQRRERRGPRARDSEMRRDPRSRAVPVLERRPSTRPAAGRRHLPPSRGALREPPRAWRRAVVPPRPQSAGRGRRGPRARTGPTPQARGGRDARPRAGRGADPRELRRDGADIRVQVEDSPDAFDNHRERAHTGEAHGHDESGLLARLRDFNRAVTTVELDGSHVAITLHGLDPWNRARRQEIESPIASHKGARNSASA